MEICKLELEVEMNLVFSDLKITLFMIATSLVLSLQMASGKDSKIMKYPYVADAQKEERILSNCNSLKRGMTKYEVIQLLGQPDEIKNTYDRFKLSEKIGESLVFVLRRDSLSGSLNEKNEKLIRLHFDNAEKLYQASALQIPTFCGIKEEQNVDIVLLVYPKRKEWKVGERIEVEIRLYNRGPKPVSVVGPLNHEKVLLTLKAKDGSVVEKSSVQKNAPKLALKDIRIHSDHFLGTTLALVTANKTKTSLSPGEYTVEAAYRTTKGKAQDAVHGVWTSEPVKIVVIGK